MNKCRCLNCGGRLKAAHACFPAGHTFSDKKYLFFCRKCKWITEITTYALDQGFQAQTMRSHVLDDPSITLYRDTVSICQQNKPYISLELKSFRCLRKYNRLKNFQ